jgi:alpha-L-arabinofuranosidase
VEWVRYANKVRGYGVRDWEIGNESYWRGSTAALKAEDYTRDVMEFSRAMKAIDPTIHIGVNGHVRKDLVSPSDGEGGPIWWQYLLAHASADIDFVVVHPYPCFEWGSYDYFVRQAPMLTEALDQVSEAVREWAPPADAARLRIQATEANAFDWAASKWYTGNGKGWAWANDLGHALVLFELLGQHLADSRVDGIQVWTTRWFDTPSRLEDVIDDDNALMPTGEAVGLWGRHLKEKLAKLEGLECGPAYVSHSPKSNEIALFLMNKGREACSVEVELAGHSGEWQATGECLRGDSENDLHPKVASTGELASRGGKILLDLPPVSIRVVELRPRGN